MLTVAFLTAVLKLENPASFPTKKSSLLGPFPKSKTLFQFLVIDEEIQNQEQTDMAFGNVKDGRVKNWLLEPVKNALCELAPNGPDAWAVGEDEEAVRAPVWPEVSRRRAPGLNV